MPIDLPGGEPVQQPMGQQEPIGEALAGLMSNDTDDQNCGHHRPQQSKQRARHLSAVPEQ
jgi:hypothetical protein